MPLSSQLRNLKSRFWSSRKPSDRRLGPRAKPARPVLEQLEDRSVPSTLTGLTGYWPFDGNGNDLSGNGYNLTLYGGVGFAPGLIGQALDLHGNGSQYAARPVSDSAFDFQANDFTIQVWVNFNSHSREQTLLEKFTGSSGPGWTLTTPGNHYQFYSNATGPINTADIITTGVWHDVIVRRSGSALDLFVDDVLAASGTASGAIASSTNPLLVGRRDAADGRDFSVDGHLDEVAIWDGALTDSEIATLWNGGSGTPVQTGFIASFLVPVDNKTAFHVNSTIPIKFQLSDVNGNSITDLSAVASLQIAPVNSDGTLGSPFEPAPTGNTSLRSDGAHYLFNWQTNGLAAGTYEIIVTLADGSIHQELIQLTDN
jgi:hypothetical protein